MKLSKSLTAAVCIPHSEQMIAGTRAARWMQRYQDDCLTVQWKETVKNFSSSLTFQTVGGEVVNFPSSSFSMCADDKEEKELPLECFLFYHIHPQGHIKSKGLEAPLNTIQYEGYCGNVGNDIVRQYGC